jgi:hypothetical protein
MAFDALLDGADWRPGVAVAGGSDNCTELPQPYSDKTDNSKALLRTMRFFASSCIAFSP